MAILIGADLVPTASNAEFFAEKNLNALLGTELQVLLAKADYRIFNLEIPLTDSPTPISKCGPALIAPVKTVAGLKSMGVDLFTIGNNHILDQGDEGLFSTMEALRGEGIAFVGAGKDLLSAAEPYIFVYGEKRVGVFACCEHEFSVASADKAGANPFDPLESPDQVAALKQKCDYLIVLYHGGKEHYRYPSPYLQKVCRKLVEKGADLVVVQHTHCIGCREEYLGGTIVYGQGNFLFDYSERECWQTGLLLRIDAHFQIGYVPVVKRGNVVRLAQGTEAEKILMEFEERSKAIEDPLFVWEQYHSFAEASEETYLAAANGKQGILFRVLNKLLGNRLLRWKLKRSYDKKARLTLQNYIECEAHRELFLEALKSKKC